MGIRVCKWDGTAVKNSLDDGVKEVLVERFGYEEDHGLMDTRLAICGLAVAVATFALAWDYFYPFPASKQVLIGCWHLLLPDDGPDSLHYLQGEGYFRRCQGQRSRWPRPGLKVGSILKHEKVRRHVHDDADLLRRQESTDTGGQFQPVRGGLL